MFIRLRPAPAGSPVNFLLPRSLRQFDVVVGVCTRTADAEEVCTVRRSGSCRRDNIIRIAGARRAVTSTCSPIIGAPHGVRRAVLVHLSRPQRELPDLRVADLDVERAAALDRRPLDDGGQDRVEGLAQVLDQDRVPGLERALELAHHVLLPQPDDLEVPRRRRLLVPQPGDALELGVDEERPA